MLFTDIPDVLTCSHCGEYIKDLAFSERFEVFVARTLTARIAAQRNEGFDVYGSEMFPDATVQVKASMPGIARMESKIVNGRALTMRPAPMWAWSETKTGDADYFVLFGINDDVVYPFLAPLRIWREESSSNGKRGRIMKVSTRQFSKCGRYASATKRNKFWQYYIHDWPTDLYRRIGHYEEHQALEQEQLFET